MGMDQAAGMSRTWQKRVSFYPLAASPPKRLPRGVKTLAAHASRPKGRGHPYANVCKKQRIIPASMRPAALGRRIPAVNVAVAVAAIIFAHVMTVLLVWLLYEVPKLALESSR